MEFWKFLDLLESSTLFFPSVDNLGDQHEGMIPEKVLEHMGEEAHGFSHTLEHYRSYVENVLRPRTFISSWSAHSDESFALWKMYGKEKLAIALKTDLDSLKKSFDGVPEDVFIGEIKYFDSKKFRYKIGNTFYSFLVKHHYYQFENEVRCLIEDEYSTVGKKVKVELNTLIKEVYISPFASDGGFLPILEFLRDKHDLNYQIKVSGVNDKWI